jgi:hypothetical protein
MKAEASLVASVSAPLEEHCIKLGLEVYTGT